MIIECRDADGQVFVMHGDGNVTVRDCEHDLQSAVSCLESASEYLRNWLVTKQSNASTESSKHQLPQGT